MSKGRLFCSLPLLLSQSGQSDERNQQIGTLLSTSGTKASPDGTSIVSQWSVDGSWLTCRILTDFCDFLISLWTQHRPVLHGKYKDMPWWNWETQSLLRGPPLATFPPALGPCVRTQCVGSVSSSCCFTQFTYVFTSANPFSANFDLFSR